MKRENRIISIVLVVMMLFSFIPTAYIASEGSVLEPSNCFTYEVRKSDAEEWGVITGYTGSETEIVIPNQIDGYVVKEIGEDAFAGTEVVQITFPETIEKIGANAFGECDALTTFVGKEASVVELCARYKFLNFISLDGSYEQDYAKYPCYKGAVANYEAVVAYLDEFYITKNPSLALEPYYSDEKQMNFLKGIVQEITDETLAASKAIAIYNWMVEEVACGKNVWNAIPKEIYYERVGGSDAHAFLLCELLRCADIPSIVVHGFVGDTQNAITEKMCAERSIRTLTMEAWVLAYYDEAWHLLDSYEKNMLSDKEVICKNYYFSIIDDGLAVYSDEQNPAILGRTALSQALIYKDGEYIYAYPTEYMLSDEGITYTKEWSSWGLNLHYGAKHVTWIDFEQYPYYFEDGTAVMMEDARSGWVSGRLCLGNYVSDIEGKAYVKANKSMVQNSICEIEEGLYWFGDFITLDISKLAEKYRTEDGHLVIEKGTSFKILPLLEEQSGIEFELIYNEDNPVPAEIDENGVFTAIENGSVALWIFKDGRNLGSFGITIEDFATELSIGDDIKVEKGSICQISFSTDTNSNWFTNCIWESSDESVVTVDYNGNITALKEGTAIITAEYADGSGLSDSCVVMVVEPLIEESFFYQFITAEGNVVNGTDVSISLCNGIEDENKVLIEHSTFGSGMFSVSHRKDVFVYEDVEYSMVEIHYTLPESYVLMDSDATTENTVWYSVENLCDGSNEITWFLEEVITEPETPIEPEVPVEPETPSIPEVDSDKLGEETIEQIEKDEDNHVEVVAPDSNKIDKDVFESMGKHDKDLTIGVKDKKNGKVKYSWTFSNKEMKNRDMEIDLNIRIADDKKHHIKNHVGDEDMLCIEFAHHGELPGPATIRNYVGDTYKDGHKVWLYYYDEEKDKIFRIGGKPLEVKDGYIEFTITHCSTYFVMNENLTNVEKDETSLADASLSVLDNEFDRTLASNETDSTVPKTGDKSLMGVYITTLFLGMTLLLTGKKHKKLS